MDLIQEILFGNLYLGPQSPYYNYNELNLRNQERKLRKKEFEGSTIAKRSYNIEFPPLPGFCIEEKTEQAKQMGSRLVPIRRSYSWAVKSMKYTDTAIVNSLPKRQRRRFKRNFLLDLLLKWIEQTKPSNPKLRKIANMNAVYVKCE